MDSGWRVLIRKENNNRPTPMRVMLIHKNIYTNWQRTPQGRKGLVDLIIFNYNWHRNSIEGPLLLWSKDTPPSDLG